ncbi:MAG: cell wall hydrolase [Acidiferrobacterales bacterium]|nr:cell wall hydrolase [Acidiferrobacterales bacterium]
MSLRNSLIALILAGLCLIHGAVYAVDFDNTKGFDFSIQSSGQELGCLAMNIYHEGRGESAKGRAAIASVTMNRVRSKRYPNTVCEVVWQRRQFSWTHIAPRHHVITDHESWQQAIVVARLFLSGAQVSLVGNATHYHSVNVQPNWQDESKLVALVGDHYFYAL